MPTITKLFIAEETAQHNSLEDSWIIVDGKRRFNDVSSCLDDHPGGEDVILQTGRTLQMVLKIPATAKEQGSFWRPSALGELDTFPELKISSRDQNTCYCKKLMDLPKQCWAVPIAIHGISVVIGFLYLYQK